MYQPKPNDLILYGYASRVWVYEGMAGEKAFLRCYHNQDKGLLVDKQFVGSFCRLSPSKIGKKLKSKFKTGDYVKFGKKILIVSEVCLKFDEQSKKVVYKCSVKALNVSTNNVWVSEDSLKAQPSPTRLWREINAEV